MDCFFALRRLEEAGFSAYLTSYSALDCYFSRSAFNGSQQVLYLTTNATLARIARIFDDLEFGGNPMSDAITFLRQQKILIRSLDSVGRRRYPFSVLNLQYDTRREVFLDPLNVYSDLRKRGLISLSTDIEWWYVIAEAAQVISRYHFTVELDHREIPGQAATVSRMYQRHLLEHILTSPTPAKGLKLLCDSGLINTWWPELGAMATVSHTKDYHPEGDVWEHTLATFEHRKSCDLVLSLGLLLHDIGKPYATAQKGKRFFAHAEIGARIGQQFLQRLGFSQDLIDSVSFLGRNHMMPAALDRVRPQQVERLMESPLFPHLLELYRADMLSTFSSPEPYYQACRLYQRYLSGKALPQRGSQIIQPRQRLRARRFRT